MRTLPEAYMTLTLAEIDAAIATFSDPLTAEEVVTLAQWWTLRAALVTAANETPDDELGLMAALGQEQQALRLIQMRDSEQKQWAGFLAIYKSRPACTETHHRLYAVLNVQSSGDPHTQRARFQQLLRAELAAGQFEAAYGALRHLHVRFDASVAQEIVISMIQAQRLTTAYELVLTQLDLMREAGLWRHLSHLMYQIAQTAPHDFCRDVLERLEMALTRHNHALPPLPANVEQREVFLASMWLGLAYLRLGQLEVAGKWLRQCDIYDSTAYREAIVTACQVGSAQSKRPRTIMALARSLTRRKINHVGVLALLRRLIDLRCPDLVWQLLPKIKITEETLIPLIAIYDRLGNSAAGDALLRDQLPRLLQGEKETAAATKCQHYAVQLIKIGRFASAVEVISAVNFHKYRSMLATTVFNLTPASDRLAYMIAQVEEWRQAPPPAANNYRDWYGDQADMMFQCARALRPHRLEQARAWAEQGAAWIASVKDRWERDTHRLHLVHFYDEAGEPVTAFAWMQQLERITETPFQLYGCVRANLRRHQTAVARAYLAFIQSRRPRLKRETLTDNVQPLFQAGIEQYHHFRRDNPPPRLTKTPKPVLVDHTSIARQWQAHPRQQLYDHLVMLAHTYPILHAIDPDLYPRVLQACLDIVAQFAPEWAAQAQALLRKHS